ncbi:MAG TPA: hypothetical protein VE046_13345 [Steroidobacteraceae bacterium]|nr:hypothetical protein [Steroidobacteraceae bacterium]
MQIPGQLVDLFLQFLVGGIARELGALRRERRLRQVIGLLHGDGIIVDDQIVPVT